MNKWKRSNLYESRCGCAGAEVGCRTTVGGAFRRGVWAPMFLPDSAADLPVQKIVCVGSLVVTDQPGSGADRLFTWAC